MNRGIDLEVTNLNVKMRGRRLTFYVFTFLYSFVSSYLIEFTLLKHPVVLSDLAHVGQINTRSARVITVLPTGQIEFRFFRRDVSSVSVVGTFNGWQADQAPMQSIGDGWWRLRLRLNDGLHQFRYLADDQWFTDFAAHGVEHSKWGMNSLIVIGRAQIAA